LNDSLSGIVQTMELPALGEKGKSAFEGGHPQCNLPGQDSRPSRLQMEQGCARYAAGIGTFRDPLEEFGGAAIFALVEGEIGFA
jgi:hypothetical protein